MKSVTQNFDTRRNAWKVVDILQTIRAWFDHDSRMNSSTATRPLAELTFRPLETHFVLKHAAFRARAILQKSISVRDPHDGAPSVTKYCAFHEKCDLYFSCLYVWSFLFRTFFFSLLIFILQRMNISAKSGWGIWGIWAVSGQNDAWAIYINHHAKSKLVAQNSKTKQTKHKQIQIFKEFLHKLFIMALSCIILPHSWHRGSGQWPTSHSQS